MDYLINTHLLNAKLLEKNISIENLSNKCSIDFTNLKNFLVGQKTLSTFEIIKLSKVLNITFNDIITLDGNINSYSDLARPQIGEMWFT